MEMDLISNSSRPKRPVPKYDSGNIVGLKDYTPYQIEDPVVRKHVQEYDAAVSRSTTGEPSKKEREKRNTSDSARKWVSRALALVMVFSAGAVAENAHIPEIAEAGFYRVLDNKEMGNLAGQFCAAFHVMTYPTQNHEHYLIGDEYLGYLKNIGPITPNIIYTVYVATGSTNEAKRALAMAVNNGNFVGDPDDVKRVLSEPLEWEAKRHELTEKFKDAGQDLDRFLDNEQAQVTVATTSARGGK